MTELLTWAYVVAAGSVLDPLYTALGWIIAWLYALLPSYGIAIILLTVAVRLALYPLTVKQTKSMQAMQRLQPEIKRLQTKYKNDRQKLNEEMMKFYKENKVNPLSGCLPLLLQLPLFIVLYRLIEDLTRTVIAGAIIVGSATAGTAAAPVQMVSTGATVPQTVVTQNVKVSGGTIKGGKLNDSVTADVLNDGKLVGQLQGTVIDNVLKKSKTDPKAEVLDPTDHKKVVGTIEGAAIQGAVLTAHPKHLPETSRLAKDLRKTPGHMDWLGMDLAKRTNQGHGAELIGMYLLVALTVVTGYYQQRQMTARTPASAQNQQMQMMGKIFPLFFGFIALQVPAGVDLYFVVSNLWQIGQQAIIFRQQDAADAAAKGGGGKGGGAAKVPAKPVASTPAAAGTPAAPAKTQSNPQPAARGGGSNPSNRNRRRRRRRKGR